MCMMAVTCGQGLGNMYEDWDVCTRMVMCIQGPGCMYMLGYACTMAAMHLGWPRWFVLAYVWVHHVHCGAMCMAMHTCCPCMQACHMFASCSHGYASCVFAVMCRHMCACCADAWAGHEMQGRMEGAAHVDE